MVEDEALVAFYVEDVLAEHGATVVGPAETLAAALRLAAQEAEGLHAAVLDLNLAGHLSWPVAELLDRMGVPFLILSGYGARLLGERADLAAAACAVMAKPAHPETLVAALDRHARPPPSRRPECAPPPTARPPQPPAATAGAAASRSITRVPPAGRRSARISPSASRIRPRIRAQPVPPTTAGSMTTP